MSGPQEDREHRLVPSLNLYATTAIVIGAVIGSGIFVSTPSMARSATSGSMLLLLWLLAGVFTLLGALTQCELVGVYPKTGGLYVYITKAFGEAAGFFYGWANFMIAGSGAIAAIAFIFANYLNEFFPLYHPPESWQQYAITIPYLGKLFPLADLGEKGIATATILFLTWLNTRGVKLGAGLQSVSTTFKVVALLVVVGVGLTLAPGNWDNLSSPHSSFLDIGMWQAFGLAVVALGSAFWAYDGWGNITYIAGEVNQPERTVPLALIIGTTIIISVYVLVNVTYLYVFPIDTLGTIPGDRAASAVMRAALGDYGAQAVALLIILSTFDTTNSSILTNSRVYYAMAHENLFPRIAGKVNSKYATPSASLWMQGIWAVILVTTGTFDLITSMYVWVNWLFYLLMALAVFVFRRQKAPRVFTIWGYPWIPILFIVFTSGYLCITLFKDIVDYQAGNAPCIKSLMGLALVLTGTPVYFLFRGRR